MPGHKFGTGPSCGAPATAYGAVLTQPHKTGPPMDPKWKSVEELSTGELREAWIDGSEVWQS